MLSLPSLILAALLSACVGNAAPSSAIQGRSIQPDLFGIFKLLEQYASAAYCANNYNSPGDKIKCGSGNCPQVEAADTKTVIEYERKETSTDVTGFVAVDRTNNLTVVSFRGTSSINSLLTDLKLDTTMTDICPGCTAHRGFWLSWLDARDRVIAAVDQARTANPNYKILITGHSLGGAIATLCAAHLRNSGLPITLYSFGAPRIGGSKISSYITNQPGGNYRITHWNDPVPNVPMIAMGYMHISPEYYINKPTDREVQIGDFAVYVGMTNMQGNAAWLWASLDAHRWYFKSVFLCISWNKKRDELDIRGSKGDVKANIVASF